MAQHRKITKKTTPLGQELIKAAKAMTAHAQGQSKSGRLKTTFYRVPEEVDVKEIRHHLHLTQTQFAFFMGTSVHAVRHWENGRRTPEGPARVLLQVLENDPQAVLRALRY